MLVAIVLQAVRRGLPASAVHAAGRRPGSAVAGMVGEFKAVLALP